MKIETHDLLSIAGSLVLAYGLMTTLVASAQDEPLSYKASPEAYKLLAENDQFRVILQTSKPGQRDAWHSHSALAIYRLSDCTSRLYLPNGKYTDADRKQGEVAFLPAVVSHSFENTGKTDCEALIVERK